ncbi:MAG TPA: hypothetical protein VK249_31930 [Anaerolineales bacterium]|nr:hypothetical protein [Anaerolineales bacterium]
MKKQTVFGIIGLVMVTWACTWSAGIPLTPTPVDEVGTIVAATMQALTVAPGQGASTQNATQTSGASVSFENVSFVLPNGLAGSANPESVPAVSEGGGAPWEVAPAHLKFTLTGYQLQGKFFEPTIFVYPADEFAQANSGAAEQIDRLKKVLSGSPLLKETLPMVSFFNAASLIAANIQLVSFQNGRGVRELTQYDQYAAPINNHELFYHFQGLTTDNKYYVIAILPINAAILAENETPAAPIPSGGVPIPTDIGPNEGYYISVTQKLNSLSPDGFTPALSALDALIQSIVVTNP